MNYSHIVASKMNKKKQMNGREKNRTKQKRTSQMFNIEMIKINMKLMINMLGMKINFIINNNLTPYITMILI